MKLVSNKSIIESVTRPNFPTWAICYVESGDQTDISPLDERQVKGWIKELDDYRTEAGATHYAIDYGKQLDFARVPQFGRSCDCVDVTINYYG